MTHRAFAAATREATKEPITFTVEGFDKSIRVKSPLPVGQLMIAARYMGGDPSGNEKQEIARVNALDDLIRKWIHEEDREAWDECLAAMTDLALLGDIVAYIIEESTGRPTQAPST